ncbi:CTRP adhesive protein, partial [Plasmodium cynomolgi strain B]
MNKSFLLIASYFFLVVHLGTVITQRSQDESSHQYVHLAGNGHSIKKATLDNDIPEGEILTKKQSFLQNNTLAAGSPPPPCVGNDCFCQNFYDLTLIIDESASIGIQNWGKHVIPFTDKIIKDLHISKNEVHVGILLFSNFIRDYVTFDKDESYKKDELLKKVDELKKKYGAGGGTKIVSALDYALEKYTHHKKGRPNAPKVTILFTDGNDTSPGSSTRLLDMGLTYRKQNVKLLVLGVAAAKDVNLREIAGCGEKNAPCPNAMKAEWETINDITKKLTNKICHTEEEDEDIITATTPPQQNTCQGDDCFCEDYYDLTLILDESGSITLNKWKIDVVPFAEKVVSNLNISKDKIHVGIMRFAVKVKEDVSYGQETRYDKNALINVVTGLRDKYGAGQGTRLVDALKHALTNFTRHPNNRPNAPKVTILFTDGNENYRGSNDVRDIGLKYRKENVRLIVVGVYKATIKSLKMLAGCNENENCPQVIKCDWDQLTSITEVITDKICDIDAGGNLPGLTDGSQNPGGAEKPGSSEKPDGTEKPGSSEKPDGTEKPGSSEKPDGTEKPGSGGPSEPEQQHPPCADWDDCYCKHFYDLTLVLDESASIGNFRWSHEVVPFATEIVKSLHVGYDAVHVGLFLFADSRRDIVRFSDATRYDKSFLLQKIESLKGDYRNGKKTYIVQALVYALMSYTKSSSRVNAPKVTMIFTDGNDSSESDERLYKTGLLYRREKVKLLVLGVSMADENRLRLLVGCMRSANCPFVIKAEWGQLPSMSNEFVRRICSSGPVIPPEVGNSPPPPPPEVVNPTDPEPVVPPCQGDECLCQSMYDLTLILDESGSIGNSNWKKQVYPFVEKIVNNLEVSESKVHVGIMLFAKKMRDFVKFSEKESYEKDSLMRKVPELKGTYKAGTHTYIVESLEYGLQHYTKGPNSRADMPKVTILFTDGNESKSGDEILSNVSSLYKKENVKLLVVGVGAASMPKLRLLGGCHKTEGDCPFAIKTEWNSLKDISQGMVDKICNTDTEIIPPPPSSGGAEVTPPSCTGEECFCKDYYDLTFIGAPSTNNNSRRKNELMEYVTRIVNSFNVGEKNVHVSLSLHLGAKMVNTDFGNAVARDKKELLSALEVMSAEYVNLGRKTNIAEALTVGLKQSFSTGHREDAPKIAVLLTDSNNDESEQGMLQSVSKQYADKKVKLLVVGIGKLPEELLFITAGCALSSSGGDHRKDQICPNVFISSRFSYINSVEKFLSGNICDNGAGGGAAVVPPPSSSLPPPNVPCQNDESCAECDDDVCNNDPTCKKVFDIAIVVDQSSSITNDQWKKYVRPFSINVIKSNYLAKNRTHVTMVKMGRTAKVLWELGRKVSYFGGLNGMNH